MTSITFSRLNFCFVTTGLTLRKPYSRNEIFSAASADVITAMPEWLPRREIGSFPGSCAFKAPWLVPGLRVNQALRHRHGPESRVNDEDPSQQVGLQSAGIGWGSETCAA